MQARFTETFLFGPNVLAVSPARYAIERIDWKTAAELPVRPSPLAQIMAVTHFARALGVTRSGNPEVAKADIAKLIELRDKLIAAKDGLLVRAGRHPGAGRVGLAALCRGQGP